MAKPPYFPFYVKDWLSSPRVSLMTLQQQGAYLRLLCHCWNDDHCSLPQDRHILSRLAGLDDYEAPAQTDEAAIWNGLEHMFNKHPTQPGRLTNERLYHEWLNYQHISHVRSEAGKKSGESRRTSVEQAPANNCSHTSSSSESETEKKKKDTFCSGSRPNGVWRTGESLLGFLNQRTGKKFLSRSPKGRPTKNLEALVQLLKEGFTEQNIKQVIANRALKWGADDKMQEFLRPSTLFRRSNFENYLGEIGKDAMPKL